MCNHFAAARAALLLAVLALLPPAFAQKKPALPADEAFLAARDAVRAGQRDKLVTMSERFKGHALEMYGPYWQNLPLRAA